MTTIGPSNDLRNMISEFKKANGGEQANVINQKEAETIKKQILSEAKGLKNENDIVDYGKQLDEMLKSEFQGTNVTSTVKVKDESGAFDTKPSFFNFNIKGKVEKESVKLETSVIKEEVKPDNKVIATGKDFNQVEKAELKNKPDGDKIIQRYDNLSADPNLFLEGNELLNSSKQDLEGLKNTFGDDAEKFLNALHENPSYTNATLDDAKTILSYAKNGCSNSNDVRNLQSALANIGKDLQDRFDKNQGVDGKYGFATMEGVRYLSSVMKPQEPQYKETVVTKEVPVKTVENVNVRGAASRDKDIVPDIDIDIDINIKLPDIDLPNKKGAVSCPKF